MARISATVRCVASTSQHSTTPRLLVHLARKTVPARTLAPIESVDYDGARHGDMM